MAYAGREGCLLSPSLISNTLIMFRLVCRQHGPGTAPTFGKGGLSTKNRKLKIFKSKPALDGTTHQLP
jgi:hypothetical protein